MCYVSGSEFKGLYAAKDYQAGDLIFELKGEIFDSPTRETIQVSPSQHQLDSYGQFTNHSCNPSALVKGNKLYAISTIAKDTEITFDYNQSEDLISSPFMCHCCGHWIKGRVARSQFS